VLRKITSLSFIEKTQTKDDFASHVLFLFSLEYHRVVVIAFFSGGGGGQPSPVTIFVPEIKKHSIVH